LIICAPLFVFWIETMFHLNSSLSYYLYPLPVDMRKSFYTLSGIVTSGMKDNVRSGGVFIFVNRDQNIMKILHMEYAGLVIYHKKLDSGRFKLPSFDENTASLSLKWQDLMLMVQSVKPRPGKLQKICNKVQ
jgi:transposase